MGCWGSDWSRNLFIVTRLVTGRWQAWHSLLWGLRPGFQVIPYLRGRQRAINHKWCSTLIIVILCKCERCQHFYVHGQNIGPPLHWMYVCGGVQSGKHSKWNLSTEKSPSQEPLYFLKIIAGCSTVFLLPERASPVFWICLINFSV